MNNVPKLRFKEFKLNYNKNFLKYLCTIIGGGTPRTENNEFWNGTIEWFTPSEIGKSKYISSSDRKITELGLNKSSAKKLPKGSILLSTRATIGEASIALKECSTNQGFQSLVVNDNCESEYLFYLITQNKNKLLKYCTGSTFREISKRDIGKLEYYIASIEEQIKIATFLSTIDNKIELLSHKLELLKLYKRGFIRKSITELKLQCDIEKLLNITKKMFSGGTPKSTVTEYYNGKIPFLKISDMTSTNKYLRTCNKFITKIGLDNSSSKILPKGNLIYSMYATIGLTVVNKIDVALPQSVMGIILNENVNRDFIYYQLESMIEYVRNTFVETGTQGNINSSIVKNLELVIPNIDIQNDYSVKFNLMNEKINCVSNQLENLKLFKKGLLQKMFV